MNKGLAIALIAAVSVGCASNREAKLKNPAPCPPAVVLADAARLVEFDGQQRLEDVAYTAEILDVGSTCRYFEERAIDASLKLRIAFGRGPKGATLAHQFSYFVAVTRRDMEVIDKAVFTLPVAFDADSRTRRIDDAVGTIMIPRANKDISGANFEIIVGLVLTPEQAIYNRSGKSLKFPDL